MKALFVSDHVDESELLKNLNPVLNSDNLWRPHALLLLGDFFVEKKEYLKAKEFYKKILSTKELQFFFYEHASSQLSLIANE